MNEELFYEGTLYSILQNMRYNFSTDSELAEHLGISASYLHDVLLKRRPIAEKLANALGYKPIRMYIKGGEE